MYHICMISSWRFLLRSARSACRLSSAPPLMPSAKSMPRLGIPRTTSTSAAPTSRTSKQQHCLLWQEAYALSEPQREKTFMIHWYCYQHHVCNDWLLFVLWVWTAVAAVAASVVFAPSKYVILHCQVSTCCIATSIVWICDLRACSIISPCYVFWIWVCCGIMILWDFDFRRINAWI